MSINLTFLSKIRLIRPSAGPDPTPNAKYENEDVNLVRADGYNQKTGYYWADVDGVDEPVVVIVPLGANNKPVNDPSASVAKPCPPACGNDGGILSPTDPINDLNTIPGYNEAN